MLTIPVMHAQYIFREVAGSDILKQWSKILDLLGLICISGYQCERCGGEQRILHPMWRYQRGPREFGSATWACHQGCSDYTKWRIVPEDAQQAGFQDLWRGLRVHAKALEGLRLQFLPFASFVNRRLPEPFVAFMTFHFQWWMWIWFCSILALLAPV